MKKLISLMLVLVMALTFVACGSKTETKTETTTNTETKTETTTTNTETTDDEIIVGSIQDISSTTSVMGLMLAEGIRWQVQTVNDNGGINGRKIKLLEYDSKANVDETINAYKRLVGEGAVAVIGPHQSNIGVAIATIVNEEKVPYLTNANDQRVARQGETGFGDPWPYSFTCQPSLYVMGAVMARYALEELGYTKFGVLYRSDNSYSVSLYDSFKAYCDVYGGEIVAVETFLSTDTDYKTMLSKLIKEDIDCLYCPNYTAELVVITQQARSLGYEGIMINGLDSAPPFSELCGPEADDVIYLSNIDMNDPDILAVVDEFRAATGNTEPNQLNKFCLGYDMMGIVVEALKVSDGGDDAEAFRSAIENTTDYNGLTGTITLDPATHQPEPMELIMHQVIDGEDVLLMPYTAEPVIK